LAWALDRADHRVASLPSSGDGSATCRINRIGESQPATQQSTVFGIGKSAKSTASVAGLFLVPPKLCSSHAHASRPANYVKNSLAFWDMAVSDIHSRRIGQAVEDIGYGRFPMGAWTR
jgi:hypothetical protein